MRLAFQMWNSSATGDLSDKGVKSPEWQVVRVCMRLKMIDEKRVSNELLGLKYKVRKEIEQEYGKNSRRSRNMIKNLRKEAAKAKKEAMTKNKTKMKHLRRKFREDEEEKVNKVPTVM